MVQLHRYADDIGAAGAQLIVIGNGKPNFIAGFREHTGYDGPLYTDPRRRLYDALELVRGVGATFNRRAILPAVQALRDGFRQRRTMGDPWQQGAVVVIDTDGSITYAYRSQHPADHPDPDEVISAARTLRAN